MKGIEAIEYFLDNWHSKLNSFNEIDEFDALVECAFGNEKKQYSTKVCIEKFFDRKICIEEVKEIKNSFYPDEVEFDPTSGNLYIRKNLYYIKIAPKIY